ncbi:hypothetical protein PCK1_001980 [Pneumocystis canis]|nr:hypothetical protein PCK1_001980 [Pneumocystis canis]
MVKPELDGSIDYYECLQVHPTATPEDIRQQYRKLGKMKGKKDDFNMRLALLYHPDRNLGNEIEFKRKFQLVNLAYEILSDVEKKRSYDRARLLLLTSRITPPKRDIPSQTPPCFRSSFASSFTTKSPQTKSPKSPHSTKSSPNSKTRDTKTCSKKSSETNQSYKHLFSKSASAYSFFYEKNSSKFNPYKPSYNSPFSSPMSKKHEVKSDTKNDVKKTAQSSKSTESKMQSSEKENLRNIFTKNSQTFDEKASSKHTFFNIKSRNEQINISCLQSRNDNTSNNQNIYSEKNPFSEKTLGLFSLSVNEKIFPEDTKPSEQSISFKKFSDTKLNESCFSFSSIPIDLPFGSKPSEDQDFKLNNGKETLFNSVRSTLRQSKKRGINRSFRYLSSQTETPFNPVFYTKIPDKWYSENNTSKLDDSLQSNKENLDLKNRSSDFSSENLMENPTPLSSKVSFSMKNHTLFSKTMNSLTSNIFSDDMSKEILLNDTCKLLDPFIVTSQNEYEEKYDKKLENEFKNIMENKQTDSTNSDLLSEKTCEEPESYCSSKSIHETEKTNKTNIFNSKVYPFHELKQLEDLTLSSRSNSSENKQDPVFCATYGNSSFARFSSFQSETGQQTQELRDTNNNSSISEDFQKKIKSLNIPDFPNPIIPLLSPSIPSCLTPSSFSVYLKEMAKYQQIWYMYSSTYMDFFKKWAEYTKTCYQSDLLKEIEVYEMFLKVTEKEEKIREGWWSEEKRYRQALRDFLNIKKQYEH